MGAKPVIIVARLTVYEDLIYLIIFNYLASISRSASMPPKRRRLAEKAPLFENNASLGLPRVPGSIPSILAYMEDGNYSQR